MGYRSVEKISLENFRWSSFTNERYMDSLISEERDQMMITVCLPVCLAKDYSMDPEPKWKSVSKPIFTTISRPIFCYRLFDKFCNQRQTTLLTVCWGNQLSGLKSITEIIYQPFSTAMRLMVKVRSQTYDRFELALEHCPRTLRPASDWVNLISQPKAWSFPSNQMASLKLNLLLTL